jgi:hypothetical protein
LTSILDGAEWTTSSFNPWKEPPVAIGWAPKVGQDAVDKRKISCPCRGEPVARRFTDWDIPASYNILVLSVNADMS